MAEVKQTIIATEKLPSGMQVDIYQVSFAAYLTLKEIVLREAGDIVSEMMERAVAFKAGGDSAAGAGEMVSDGIRMLFDRIDTMTPVLIRALTSIKEDEGMPAKDVLALRELILQRTDLFDVIQLEGNFLSSLQARFPAVGKAVEAVKAMTRSASSVTPE